MTRPFVLKAVATCVAAMMTGAVFAQEAASTAAPAPIVLKAARLFDSTTGALRSNGVVVVQGEKIVGVGANATVPSNAHVIDLGDATLIAGFIDSHTHITDEFNANYYLGVYQKLM